VVFAAQELTVRLAIYTGKGQAELIKEHYGKKWAWFAAVIILITCTGALTSEISGIMGVGQIFGIPIWASALMMDAFLIAVVFTGSYERVEKIAICVGLFELVFVVTMIMAFPTPQRFISGVDFPVMDGDFLSLVSANIGAVIMPWMIFYQQSASVVRQLKIKDLKMERIETAIGACLTQLVMIAAIITTAGTIWDGNLPSDTTINSIPDISSSITPHLGFTAGRILFSLGMIGGAMIGAIVVSITAAWTIGEAMGEERKKNNDLTRSPREAPGFYIVYMLMIITATTICILSPNYLVDINIFAEVLNAVLVPVVLLFTFLLSYYHLPEEIRLKGRHSVFIAIVFSICSIFSIGATIYSLYQIFTPSGDSN